MRVKLFRKTNDLYEEMLNLRDRNDAVEPMGFFENLPDGSIRMHYVEDDLDIDLDRRKQKTKEFVFGKKFQWHGHPNGHFEYDKKNLLAAETEDGNPNKPSVPDLVYFVTQPLEQATIAVPDGIIVIEKKQNDLVQNLSGWLNRIGITKPSIFDLYGQCILYCTMKNNGVIKYNTSTWMKGVTSIGFDCKFYDRDILKNEPLVPTRKVNAENEVVRRQNDYLDSERMKRDLFEVLQLNRK